MHSLVPSCAAVIPARYASTRFPGKPLARLAGKPMVQHVYERCIQAGCFSQVVVATDDARIAQAVEAFGGQAMLSSPHCPSGTDRVAELASKLPSADVLVNVQGDEPLLNPQSLGVLCRGFTDPEVKMATLVRPLLEEERASPHVVKVVRAQNGDALYFSRADIPFHRQGPPPTRWGHVGIYGYRRKTLAQLAASAPTPLELSESLEQLRALEHGISIRCLETEYRGFGIDTPEDLARAAALLT